MRKSNNYRRYISLLSKIEEKKLSLVNTHCRRKLEEKEEERERKGKVKEFFN